MDCPIGTVRSRLHRARKMLYSLLYQYAGENGYIKLKKVKNNSRRQIEINKMSRTLSLSHA